MKKERETATKEKTNVFAIIGFIFTFIIPLLGLIFCVVALNQINNKKQRGKGLAIAGTIISSIFVIVMIIGISLGVSNLSEKYSDSNAQSSPSCKIIQIKDVNLEIESNPYITENFDLEIDKRGYWAYMKKEDAEDSFRFNKDYEYFYLSYVSLASERDNVRCRKGSKVGENENYFYCDNAVLRGYNIEKDSEGNILGKKGCKCEVILKETSSTKKEAKCDISAEDYSIKIGCRGEMTNMKMVDYICKDFELE